MGLGFRVRVEGLLAYWVEGWGFWASEKIRVATANCSQFLIPPYSVLFVFL